MTAPPRQTMLATAPVSKLIWTFAIPAILSQVVNSMHNIVDQTFLGWGIGDLEIWPLPPPTLPFLCLP